MSRREPGQVPAAAGLPLDGLTVVALEQAVAAPFATRQLADLGARVIKVERPGAGDFARGYDHAVHGQSSYFVWLNRGKESIELDLKRARRPGRAGRPAGPRRRVRAEPRAGRGRAARPRRGELPPASPADHCSISGYGPDGPYRPKKAYDLLVQCEAGLLSVTGTAGRAGQGRHLGGRHRGRDVRLLRRPDRPVRAGADRRGRQLRGGHARRARRVDEPARTTTASTAAAPPRTGARHASISPYGPYAAADGGQVFLGIQNEREWPCCCASRSCGRPDLVTDERFATNPARVAHHDELLTAIINGVLRRIAGGRARARRWTRRASPTPGCAPPRSSPPTRSWRPGTGGGRWTRRAARSARCCRRSRAPAGRRRWARSRRSASTPRPSARNSASQSRRHHHDHDATAPAAGSCRISPWSSTASRAERGLRAPLRERRPVLRRPVGHRGRRRRGRREPGRGGRAARAVRAVGPADRVRPGPAHAAAR